jgi:CubicO group peptidase (beta-lactamase class C family)
MGMIRSLRYENGWEASQQTRLPTFPIGRYATAMTKKTVRPIVAVEGYCDPAFAAVREVFQEQIGGGAELGAAVAVQVGGRPVVDLWGGSRDAAGEQPWQRDTLVNVWSTTKGVVALCAHLLVDRGLLDLDAPVARYWPEFAEAGKGELPVRYLLSHRAGLAGLREPTTVEDLFDWKVMVERLAATKPWWEPGTVSGYHAMTYGYLVGEVIRRVSGSTVGELLRADLAGPLGADFHIGLPDEEHGRVATLVQPPPADASEQAALFAQLSPVAIAAVANPMLTGESANTPAWRRAEIPAANGHGTARGIATLYGVYAQGGTSGGSRYLSTGQVQQARQGQGACTDLVLGPAVGGAQTEVGLGVLLSGPDHHYGPNERALGHDGYGGSFGMADPEAGLSIGYAMNLMGQHIIDDPRKMALIEAVYQAV